MVDFHNKKRLLSLFLVTILVGSLMTGLVSCAVKIQAQDLMKGISSDSVTGKNTDAKFISNISDFNVELFKSSIKDNENSLISPLSVILALSMTTNGAANQTLEQMREALAKDISLDDLNAYLYTYVKNLPNEKDSKLNIANSIWFRDDASRLSVEEDFLQKNADYYNASAYKSAFDNQTLLDINNWVKAKTDGLIDKILDEIRDDAVMYLINALVFDAKWEKIYSKEFVKKGDFTAFDGTKKSVDMMDSEEKLYLEDEKATGFIKPYKNNKYSFVALLPNQGISINDYIDSLTGESFYKIINEPKNNLVSASLPKFSYEYKITMNEPLKGLGMTDAFSASVADFSKLGKSTIGNLYIGEVIHKTFISVGELGTKAGAVTKVEIRDTSQPEYKYVILNRPFVYAIIDNATTLPIFIGTVIDFG